MLNFELSYQYKLIRWHVGKFLKVEKAPALPGGGKSRQNGSAEREGIWCILETKGTSVVATTDWGKEW